VFHIIKARLLELQGATDEAVRMIDAALALPGVRRPLEGKQPPPLAVGVGVAALFAGAGAGASVQLSDRVTVFVVAVRLMAAAGRTSDAVKLLAEAKHEFSATAELPRLALCEADLATARGDFDAALKVLGAVPAESPQHTNARIAASEIHLRHRKNRAAYAACFADLAAKNGGGSVHAHVLYGEALMRIQEPERAIRAYEEALKLNPSDATLASKIGRALVTTHDYGRALRYYESAVAADPTRSALFYELIELMVKLGRLDEATARLRARRQERAAAKRAGGAGGHSAEDDVHAAIGEVRSCLLLAKVFKSQRASGSGSTSGSQQQDEQQLQSLTDAWAAQKEVLALAKGRDADLVVAQREAAADIAYQLAQVSCTRRDREMGVLITSAQPKLHIIANQHLLVSAQHQNSLVDSLIDILLASSKNMVFEK
jgi:tetratricopeptide repeat protein 21B